MVAVLYYIIYFIIITFLMPAGADVSSNSPLGPGGFFNFLFPTENLSSAPTRSDETRKAQKLLTYVMKDTDMTDFKSVQVGTEFVGKDYTISAVVPGLKSDHLYLLRRRQDKETGLSGFTSDGHYDRLNEGAIPVDCVLKLNLTTQNIEGSYGNNTFYYPNAMVRDPQGKFWFSDSARHQVLQFNNGSVTPHVTIGKRFIPGSSKTELCAPNDIAVTSRHVYVADGRCNDRVVMFSKTGTYISEFGNAATSDSSIFHYDREIIHMRKEMLKRPEAIAVDEATDTLYVSDGRKSTPRVLLVSAGVNDISTFGSTYSTRPYQHSQLRPVAGRIALHHKSHTVFLINSYSSVYLHRGFTFSTDDTTFMGAWGPDERGFVRPRAVAVSADGTSIYVADANQLKPETIWIFTRSENLRARRNVKLHSSLLKGSNGIVKTFHNAQPSMKGLTQLRDIIPYRDSSIRFDTIYRFLQSKGSSNRLRKLPTIWYPYTMN